MMHELQVFSFGLLIIFRALLFFQKKFSNLVLIERKEKAIFSIICPSGASWEKIDEKN